MPINYNCGHRTGKTAGLIIGFAAGFISGIPTPLNNGVDGILRSALRIDDITKLPEGGLSLNKPLPFSGRPVSPTIGQPSLAQAAAREPEALKGGVGEATSLEELDPFKYSPFIGPNLPLIDDPCVVKIDLPEESSAAHGNDYARTWEEMDTGEFLFGEGNMHGDGDEDQGPTSSSSISTTGGEAVVYHEIPAGDLSEETLEFLNQHGSGSTKLSERGLDFTTLDHDTLVIVLNATPYRWRRGYVHSYQMPDWGTSWPEYIPAGQMVQLRAKRRRGTNSWDSAAEVAYHLEGTEKPMSLMIGRKTGRYGEIWVRLLEDLETLGNKKGSLIDLGHRDLPDGISFLLAGKEGRFVSSNLATAWMQSQLEDIGNLTLREIAMPRSHHAGLWKPTHQLGFASPSNTQAQEKDLEFQLTQGGARVLDFRANIWTDKKVYEAHGSWGAGMYNGLLGARLDDMVDTINTFNDDHPGELIIWDVHSTDAWRNQHGMRKLKDEDRPILYDAFKRLKHRFPVPDKEKGGGGEGDLTKWTLNRFIGDGKPAVLIRVSEEWAKSANFPGGKEGFVTTKNFPIRAHWSNIGHVDAMIIDQLEHLHENRKNRTDTLYLTDWLVTPQGVDLIGGQSLIDLASRTYVPLFTGLWWNLTSHTYPNWIGMDAIRSGDLKTMAGAINLCFAAKKCGTLGGRVEGEEQ